MTHRTFPSRLKSTAAVPESLFGPPLESACLKPGRFAGTGVVWGSHCQQGGQAANGIWPVMTV